MKTKRTNRKLAVGLAIGTVALIVGFVVLVMVLSGPSNGTPGEKGAGGAAGNQVVAGGAPAGVASESPSPGSSSSSSSTSGSSTGSSTSGAPSGTAPTSTTPSSSTSSGSTRPSTLTPAPTSVPAARAWVTIAEMSGGSEGAGRTYRSEVFTLHSGTTRNLAARGELSSPSTGARLEVDVELVPVGHSLGVPQIVLNRSSSSATYSLPEASWPEGQYYLRVDVLYGSFHVSVNELW
jgi:hypothetical protein